MGTYVGEKIIHECLNFNWIILIEHYLEENELKQMKNSWNYYSDESSVTFAALEMEMKVYFESRIIKTHFLFVGVIFATIFLLLTRTHLFCHFIIFY